VGENSAVTTSASDTLIDIAARYQLGYNLIRSANPGVDAWLPGEGAIVTLPFNVILPAASRSGIVINVAEMRLYFYPQSKPGQRATVAVYPISVGRGEWATPVTRARVTGRAKDPIWYPPASIRAEHAERGDILPMQVPAGPDNPLGQYLLMLDIPGYFIHGTNKRFGIGMQVTHGCVRMYGSDIEQLVKLVANDTAVTIINQPFKTGWLEGELYLEVHPLLELEGAAVEDNRADIIAAVVAATRYYPETRIDWDGLDTVIAEAKGLPVKVGVSP
jgi:L,D-transpeptidase ErfK/SrfK